MLLNGNLLCVAIGDGTKQCAVRVVISGLVASVAESYIYEKHLTSVITSVSPSRGGTGGGTKVTIEGSNFGCVDALLLINLKFSNISTPV